MTGPEHYRAAEALLKQLQQAQTSMTSTVTHEKASAVMAEAQVHATLAHAAATALSAHPNGVHAMPAADYQAWHKTLSVQAAAPEAGGDRG